MGTPFGRQNSGIWKNVQEFDKETARKLTYTIGATIRHLYPHDNCTHENCCKNCEIIIGNAVRATREEYEIFAGHMLSEIFNIKCPFPHNGD